MKRARTRSITYDTLTKEDSTALEDKMVVEPFANPTGNSTGDVHISRSQPPTVGTNEWQSSTRTRKDVHA